jgi:hypothetical protein
MFDSFFNKRKYKKQFSEDDMPGVDAINRKEKEIYGEQEPLHYATIVPYELGGPDPLWAVDCFENGREQKHFHFISLGFSNLFYDAEAFADEYSKYGFELTFRHLPFADDPEKPIWPVNLIQNIAKYVFKSNKGFDDFHFMSANGPIRSDTDTDITAFMFFTDTEMGEIDTPHGKVKFLQLYGIKSQEYLDLKEKKYTAKDFIEKQKVNNPLLITDLTR